MSKKQISYDKSKVSIFKNDIECCETNPDADKLEILNDSNVKITVNNIISSLNDSAVINTIQSDLCIDIGELKYLIRLTCTVKCI